MAKKSIVSMAVIRRLPRYHRYLEELLKNDIKRISSKELSEKMGVTASQIRQDLNNYGGFGQQGYGYNVEELYNTISKILGLDRTYNTIVIGAGNLGQAIARYTNFERKGFKVKGIFDIKSDVIGTKIKDIEIMDIDKLNEFISNNNINIAILCIPKDNAQKIADRLTKNGIKAIWNFSPIDLRVPDDVILENVHLSDSLLTVSYRLNEEDLFKNNTEEK
jgi:redox-sensing transcriptional repressor